jgi:hypothetical protein
MAVEIKQQKTESCTGNHSEHLCYFISQGFHLTDEQEFRALIKDAKYRCNHCGRHAKSDANLCVPVPL